jgi:hypothetical protein
MGFAEMVVAIVFIGCATEALKAFAHKRPGKGEKALRSEVEALREEVRQLRQHGNDSILSFDATLHRLDQRVAHVESRLALPPGASAESTRPAEIQAHR